MTKELSKEVEEIVQDFYMIFCGTFDGKVVVTLHDAPQMLAFLREQLISLAEKAEERGKEQAEFENKKLQEMTAYSEGFMAGEELAASIAEDGSVHPFTKAYGDRRYEIGCKRGYKDGEEEGRKAKTIGGATVVKNLLASARKEGAKVMLEKAIACVPPKDNTPDADEYERAVRIAWNACHTQILAALTSLSLTNE